MDRVDWENSLTFINLQLLSFISVQKIKFELLCWLLCLIPILRKQRQVDLSLKVWTLNTHIKPNKFPVLVALTLKMSPWNKLASSTQFLKTDKSLVWWLHACNSRQGQNSKLEASLDYIVRFCLKKSEKCWEYSSVVRSSCIFLSRCGVRWTIFCVFYLKQFKEMF